MIHHALDTAVRIAIPVTRQEEYGFLSRFSYAIDLNLGQLSVQCDRGKLLFHIPFTFVITFFFWPSHPCLSKLFQPLNHLTLPV